jgi:hypothetical protein
VHDLDVLLHFTGRETRIKTSHMTEWSVVTQWDPEARYKPVGSANRAAAALMISSAETLLKAL